MTDEAGSMPLKILRWIDPQALAEDEASLRWLYESIEANPLSDTIEDILEAIYAKQSILWSWGSGVLLTSFRQYSRGKALAVSNVRGKGFLANLAAIEHDINLIARDHGFRWIVGEVPHPGLVRAYVKHGGLAFAQVLREVRQPE